MMNLWHTQDWPPRHRMGVILGALLLAIGSGRAVMLPFFEGEPERLKSFDAALKAGWVVKAATPAEADGSIRAEPGADGTIVIQSPRLNLTADLCPTPYLEASCEAEGLLVSFAWRRRGDPAAYEVSKTIQKRTPRVGVGNFQLGFRELPVHPAWKGRIEYIAWRISAARQPVRLHRVGAEYVGPELMVGQWRSFQPIDVTSINTIRAPHVLGYPPVTLLVLACTFGFSLYVAIAAARRRAIRPGVGVGMIMAAWVINDARWMSAQRDQLSADRAKYRHETSEFAPAAAWPPEIWRIATAARQTLPAGATYAVAGGNLPTAAGDSRLRYLLSPGLVQVNVDPLQPRVPPEAARYVLVLSPQAAPYEPDGSWLFTQGLPPIRAEVIKRFNDGAYIARRMEP